MNPSLTDQVRRVAEALEGGETLEERGVLEHRFVVGVGGSVQEVRAVLTVGGPHIEVRCLSGVVVGRWSGESHRRAIESDAVERYGRRQAERMESRID